MSSPLASTGRSVLIVDESSESREVLRTVLERRGMRIFEARGALQGLELARQHHPEVIVLDLESEAADEAAIQDQYDAQTDAEHSSLVILGTARRYDEIRRNTQVVAKPYHYGPLIRTIEQLLAQSAVAGGSGCSNKAA